MLIFAFIFENPKEKRPILDPLLQYFLLNKENKQKNSKSGYSFFFKYLKIASKNKYRNNTTIWSSMQFKNDLQSSIPFLNEEFGCGFQYEKHFLNTKKQDYYEILFNKIKFESDTKKLLESKKSIGTYLVCDDKFHTLFYQPCVFFFFQNIIPSIFQILLLPFYALTQKNLWI